MKTMSNRYTLVATADGSCSVFDEASKECMHSAFGAWEESLIKHVTASGVCLRAGDEIAVLDIGFGIGYNILALLYELNRQGISSRVRIISLELSREVLPIMEKIRFNDERDAWYGMVVEALKTGTYRNETISIEVLIGDARTSVRLLAEKKARFDAVFQDAYSPGKNPELWSLDFFSVVAGLMKNDAVITTYSAAPQIRRALIENGLHVARAVSTGLKKEGTIASKGCICDMLTNAEIDEIRNDIRSTVYRDEQLNASRDDILARRIEEMKRLRSVSSHTKSSSSPRIDESFFS